MTAAACLLRSPAVRQLTVVTRIEHRDLIGPVADERHDRTTAALVGTLCCLNRPFDILRVTEGAVGDRVAGGGIECVKGTPACRPHLRSVDNAAIAPFGFFLLSC